MEFCKCETKKEKIRGELLCPKCNVTKSDIPEDEIIWERNSDLNNSNIEIDSTFPFEREQFYSKKEVWQQSSLSNQGGIRYNKNKNFLVVFMDAPELYRKQSQGSNIYHDTFNDETGLYQYTGAGQIGPQTFDKENGWLKNSEANNTPIHFFRQFSVGNKHQYIGQVQVEKIIKSMQPDNKSQTRRVYIFFLLPII